MKTETLKLIRTKGSQRWYQRPNGSIKIVSQMEPGSQTQQQFADQCDINKIMRKYHNDMRLLPQNQGNYLDLSTAEDYQTSLDVIRRSSEAFSSLSSEVRKKFDNDPTQFLNFMADPKNNEEQITLGLRKKAPIKELTLTEQVAKEIATRIPVKPKKEPVEDV